MASEDFRFQLFRLYAHHTDLDGMLPYSHQRIKNDADFNRVFAEASSDRHDQTIGAKKATYLWSLRSYQVATSEHDGQIGLLHLSRAVASRKGDLVTPAGLVPGESTSSPPLAEHQLDLVIYFKRHLVAAQIEPTLFQTPTWKKALEKILQSAARSLSYDSSPILEAIPREEEVLRAFLSFSKLIRLRVKLRLPNPDTTRLDKRLLDLMDNGRIRDLTQDMHNDDGLNQAEEALPYASAMLAQAGYKDGSVLMRGIRDGRPEQVKTGQVAAEGSLHGFRDFIRGLRARKFRSKEAAELATVVAKEFERILGKSNESQE